MTISPRRPRREGDVYNYHTDALGSVTEMTDDNETVVQSYEYSAFGKILSQSGTLASINPFTYTAREFDSESGLYYYRYRYYSADVGRFITYDPIYWLGGANLYVYVNNNPINYTDPYGLLQEEDDISIWDHIWAFIKHIPDIWRIELPAPIDKDSAKGAIGVVKRALDIDALLDPDKARSGDKCTKAGCRMQNLPDHMPSKCENPGKL